MFWSVTLLPLEVDYVTIHDIKGHYYYFHITPYAEIFISEISYFQTLYLSK